MAESPSDKPQDGHQESEIDRYERLQLASEREMERISDAYEQHSSLLKNGVLAILGLAALLIGIFSFGFFHSMSEFKQNVRDNLNDQVTSMNRTLENAISGMTNRVEAEINQENRRIDTAIDERFKRENIEPMIEAKVGKKVDQLTDKIIAEAVHKQIDPEFAAITNELTLVEGEIGRAKISSEDVREALDLSMNIAMAQGGDRHAFDQLLRLRDSGTNRYALAISETINTLTVQLYQEEIAILQPVFNWDFYKFNPDTNSLDDYLTLYGKVGDPVSQALILQKLSEQTRFPRASKLELYRLLLQGTPSLKVLCKTSRIVDGEAHLGLNILGTPDYLRWVKSQLCEVTISNLTQTIQTNKSDVTSYIYRAIGYAMETNYDLASKDYQMATAIGPTNTEALNSYAWFLAVCPDDSFRDGGRAVKLAMKACELDPSKSWMCIGTLAAAEAESGDFDQAIKFEKQAIGTAGISDAQAEKEKHRLELFQQHKPTHEPFTLWPD